MNKILFYGNFGVGESVITNGQTSKAINFYKITSDYFKNTNIEITQFNTANFKRNPIINYFKLRKAIQANDVIVIFPGGLTNLKVVKHICEKHKDKLVFYPVVGGWLADRIKGKKNIVNWLKQIKCIYPETKGLEAKLHSIDICNTKISPVFTIRNRIPLDEILSSYKERKSDSLRFVYFGRISEKKGIYLAIDAINKINELSSINCTLDFYGALQKEENLSKFNSMLNNNIRYLGKLPDDKVQCLGDYDFFLFPTFYEGEGFPATCVESLTYGTPIIASKWAYNNEIVKNGFNGFLFDLNKADNLCDVILQIINEHYDIIQLKKNAFESSLAYLPNIAVKPFIDDLEEVINGGK